jgi:hypothetical protein
MRPRPPPAPTLEHHVKIDAGWGVTTLPRHKFLASLAQRQTTMLQPNAPDLIHQAPLTGKEAGLESYVAWTRHKKSTDADVGIEEFVSPDLVGIGGLVKARWTDFRVNEVRLRDGSPVRPPRSPPPRTAPPTNPPRSL